MRDCITRCERTWYLVVFLEDDGSGFKGQREQLAGLLAMKSCNVVPSISARAARRLMALVSIRIGRGRR
jgi:hypothetical protein